MRWKDGVAVDIVGNYRKQVQGDIEDIWGETKDSHNLITQTKIGNQFMFQSLN